VTVDLRGDDKKAEILLDAEHKHNFVAHAEATDLLTAVTAAVVLDLLLVMGQLVLHLFHRRDPSHGGTGGIKS
jgi:putative sigma-54 modulation protein